MINFVSVIKELLEEKFTDTPLFLVEVKTKTTNKLKIEIFIDHENQPISINDCIEISRFVEEQLESKKIVPEDYVLEVSSAGVGNPIKEKRQYNKHIGKTFIIKLLDGNSIEGTLIKVNPLNIELQEQLKKSKKKTLTENLVHQINFVQIKEAKLKIEFLK